MTGPRMPPADAPPTGPVQPATPGGRLRLFVALWPTPAVRDAIAAWQGRWAWPAGAKPVAAERLHLTLQFLGMVPEDRLPALAAALATVAVQPLTTRWGRVQDWDGIAVLRPLAMSGALQALHEACGRAVQAAGLPTEARRFRPHLTLARKARGALPPAGDFRLDWACDGGFALVQSVGQGGGYRVLRAFTPQG